MERSRPDPVGGEGSAAPSRWPDGKVPADPDQLLTPGEVAELFGVTSKTVARWSDAGRLDVLRTLGGHRRYRSGDVAALLEEPGG